MHSQTPTEAALALTRPRVLDFLALAKPELTLLSVLTAVGGAYLAIGTGGPYLLLVHTFLGTLLVGAGAGALNMYFERECDALMKRTQRRPIPAGRVTPFEALAYGMTAAIIGIAQLAVFTHLLAGFLALVTLVTYLFLYTPLKRLTPFATVVGAVPGALPPVIGWAAVRGELGLEAWSLFAILFFWQIPHFLSLAWMYRQDYARAGYRMLTVLDTGGVVTGRQILVYSIVLLPASLLPTYVGLLGLSYFFGALLLSSAFLLVSTGMARRPSNIAARRLFFASLVYLTTLVLLMVADTI
jgi:protoheme IX farnesyltransferase